MNPGKSQQGSKLGQRPSSPSATKVEETQMDRKPRLKITPFHNSISSNDASLRGKRPGPGSKKTLRSPDLFLNTPGRLAADNSWKQGLNSGSSHEMPAGEEAQTSFIVKHSKFVDKKTPKMEALNSEPASNPEPIEEQKGKERRATASGKPKTAARKKKKKRKMGMYNLVPKKKQKTVKQHKKEVLFTQIKKPKEVGEKPRTAEQHPSVISDVCVEGPRSEGGNHAEYTELALDCLDLKAQQELLSPPNSGAAGDVEVTDKDLAEELPLCCCRMETPNIGGGLTSADQTCMAVESVNGALSRCQRPVMKQEMMRPSNTVHLLVLCEDHRAGMVKHQCCPGCGLFCRVGTFMECRPYGSISHRFHQDCASILKACRFCPHCGEDASGAVQVVVSKADQSPSVPRSNPGPLVPVVATLPSVPTTPAVPQVLRAKKSSEPRRSRDESPSRLKDDASDKIPKESLESILMALDDENLKLKVTYPDRQLYLSAKQGDLQRVIQLLVDGKDPNRVIDGQNKRTPLFVAAAGGHQEICHMLVQAGANLEFFDEDHRTPLMAACENKHLETVKYLIRAGAAVGHKDITGFTCLHLAAKLGHYDIIHYLLTKASKYINCQDDGGWTAISWATEFKHKELVNLLLAKGADVNIRDKEENVCLHWAALSGCDDIAQALLEAHCDLSAVNIHRDTPLHVAARENHLECVMLFLSRGADITQRNKEGDTPLDCCSSGSKVWTALNTNKKLTEARRGRDAQGEKLLSRDISRGYEAIPISCVNGVDSEPFPGNFKYIPEYCVTSPLNIDKDITHLQHCVCSDDCLSSSCMCGQLSLRCWYDSEGRLPQDFAQWEPPFLFECNHACSCWRTCRNRVIQNGLRVRLQVYRTERIGWGVRALQDIPQGTFICEYVGEIITDAEADKRENDTYLFTLNNKVSDVYCMDARLFGNIGRFINHLCEPNIMTVKVFTTHQDLRFPRVAFFSSKPIKAGEQIGMDYGDNFWRVKRKYFSCQCGSLKCRHSSASR